MRVEPAPVARGEPPRPALRGDVVQQGEQPVDLGAFGGAEPGHVPLPQHLDLARGRDGDVAGLVVPGRRRACPSAGRRVTEGGGERRIAAVSPEKYAAKHRS